MDSTATTDMDERAQLDRLWARGREFLGCDIAIMGGAMTWVSERNLVAAISEAGAFGVIACGAMDPDRLALEIAGTRALTDRPFGVNLITMHPELDALIDICGDMGVSHVVLAGGLPGRAAMRRVKGWGARLVCFAPALPLARKLIVEGAEAGGHTGPVATAVLAQEILPAIRDVPVFVAGGIGRGEAILAFLEMGAAGCQIGTRFAAADESIAHPRFKKAFLRGEARDAVLSQQVDPRFPVVPVRALANDASRRFGEFQHEVIARHRAGELDLKAAQLEIEHFWAGALRRAVIEGDVDNGSMMAGQSVGMVKRVEPVSAILDELCGQALAMLAQRRRV